MKPFLKNILFWSVAMLLITCDEKAEVIVYKGPDFVFFDSKPQLTLYENQKTALSIPLKVSLPQTGNTSVSFEVIGENLLAGSDYKIQTTSPVSITRGKYETSISILPVDNSIIQPEIRSITVRITAIDNPSLKTQVVSEVKINLLEDDCLPTVPKVSLWVGSVFIQGGAATTATGTAEGGAGGICGGSLSVTGKFFGDANPTSTMTVIMTQNQTVTTKGIASVVLFPLFGNDQYDYQANGTYDETVKTITMNYTVYDHSDGSVVTTGTHIISPK